jgi:hypothetical protein
LTAALLARISDDSMALPGGVICKGPKCIVIAVSGMVIDNALRPA